MNSGECLIEHDGVVFGRLMRFLRSEYRIRGYQEVITPMVFNKDLWETSGHWQNYKEDMFIVTSGIHGHANCSHGHNDADNKERDEVRCIYIVCCVLFCSFS